MFVKVFAEEKETTLVKTKQAVENNNVITWRVETSNSGTFENML